jgi:SpoU rRNA Methylase family
MRMQYDLLCYIYVGCVDVWDPKVLKSVGVAPFKIKLRTDVEWSNLEATLPLSNSCILLADCGLKESTCNDDRHLIPLHDYNSLYYQSYDNILLVIGGETHGISQSAYNLCASGKGHAFRIRIPMLPDVDSLNSAMSATIILYEIHRQLSALVSNQQ